jgi:hypothetical protein
MISSAALPKVALSSPLMPSPVRTASSSVALPSARHDRQRRGEEDPQVLAWRQMFQRHGHRHEQ